MLVALLLVELAIAINLDSWQVYRAETQKAQLVKHRLEQAHQEKLRLLEELGRLQSPGGMEEAARGLGFRKQGEMPLPAPSRVSKSEFSINQ
ncbi:MAG: hypothetical protein QXI19_13060 [Candidatus Caldarchaeum sp.]